MYTVKLVVCEAPRDATVSAAQSVCVARALLLYYVYEENAEDGRLK